VRVVVIVTAGRMEQEPVFGGESTCAWFLQHPVTESTVLVSIDQRCICAISWTGRQAVAAGSVHVTAANHMCRPLHTV
jgi:hypothetical protein